MDTLRQALNRKFPAIANRLIGIWDTYVETDFDFKNITKTNLVKFVDGLRSEVSLNSAGTYAKAVKSTLNEFNDQIKLPDGYQRYLTLKTEATISVWLTIEEIEALIAYEPKSEIETLVKSQFILGCLTGARHSDFINFTEENIQNDNLVYISQKTKVRTELPLAERARQIILSGEAIGLVSDVTFNKYIKEICRKAGMTETVQIYRGGRFYTDAKHKFIASHTARRSFATNLYLRCHDLFRVSKYMGHSSVNVTASYIMSIGAAPPEVMEFFEKFK